MKKKCIVLAISAAVLVSSCDTYAGAGAASGAYFGSILGSAIGGIADGPYGSDVGTLIGMAGGAVVGAAVGNAADQSRQADQRKYEEYKQEKQRQAEVRRNRSLQNGNNGYQQDPNYGYQQGSNYGYQQGSGQDDSGFDPNNGGDDRIDFDGGQQPSAPARQPQTSTVQPQTVEVRSISLDQLKNAAPGYKLNYNKDIELRNALFNDADRDGLIRAGEECKISFEIMNNSNETLYDVYPTVIETTGNKHIHISPSLRVENIVPHKGVRYTATVYGDSRLKDGEAIINVSVTRGNKQLTTDIKEFRIATMR